MSFKIKKVSGRTVFLNLNFNNEINTENQLLLFSNAEFSSNHLYNFDMLPDELILYIFTFLDDTSLFDLMSVSRRYSRIAKDFSLWILRYKIRGTKWELADHLLIYHIELLYFIRHDYYYNVISNNLLFIFEKALAYKKIEGLTDRYNFENIHQLINNIKSRENYSAVIHRHNKITVFNEMTKKFVEENGNFWKKEGLIRELAEVFGVRWYVV